ncbi:MAG TPA: hypothetical protein VFU47_09890, partial [Armatimonadota bacterium]|nr:hypothetical protein [Armatimonadota bacterium]
MPRTIQRQLEEDYVDAATAARELGMDKSHLTTFLRAGRVPGAFQWGTKAFWIIPRSALPILGEMVQP